MSRRTFAQRMSPPPDWPVPSYKWPRYLVSSRHAVVPPGGPDRVRVPFDVWHAREVGSPYSACGAHAEGWKFFWTLRFRDAGARACPECARVTRQS